VSFELGLRQAHRPIHLAHEPVDPRPGRSSYDLQAAYLSQGLAATTATAALPGVEGWCGTARGAARRLRRPTAQPQRDHVRVRERVAREV